jgi:hypothetical protein
MIPRSINVGSPFLIADLVAAYHKNDTSSYQLLDSLPTPTTPQRNILITMGIMAIVICFMWNVKYLKSILYPFKLITVAFHEFGHAIMVFHKDRIWKY